MRPSASVAWEPSPYAAHSASVSSGISCSGYRWREVWYNSPPTKASIPSPMLGTLREKYTSYNAGSDVNG